MVINALGNSFLNAELAVFTSWFRLAKERGSSITFLGNSERIYGTFRQKKKKSTSFNIQDIRLSLKRSTVSGRILGFLNSNRHVDKIDLVYFLPNTIIRTGHA